MFADLKLAVTGAIGASGQTIRALLAAGGVPIEQVRLLEQVSEEAIISEYAGHPTLIGTLDPEALADRDLVFLCGTPEESKRCLLWEHKRGALHVDLSGAAVSRRDVPVVNVEVDASKLQTRPAVVAAPHPLSFALTSTLARLERAFGLARVAAVILRPVSDFGEAGIEELHRQTVSLLNFTDLPRKVFGRQLGFNLLSQESIHGSWDGNDLEARLAWEVEQVFGWEAPRASMRVLIAPIFHGHTLLIHAVLREKASLAAARRSLAETPGLILSPASSADLSPVEAATQHGKAVVSLAPDGLADGGLWLWVVGSNFLARAASNAVEIAARVLSG